MQLYCVMVTKTKHGYLAKQENFGLAVDADTLENAISAIREQIEQEGVIRLKNGKTLPESSFLVAAENSNDESIIYIQVDIEKKFRDSATESVRKNISMPAWMDIQLRYYGVDASKLFQDAAVAFLKKKNKVNVQYKKIETVDELVESVDQNILNQYVMNKLMK